MGVGDLMDDDTVTVEERPEEPPGFDGLTLVVVTERPPVEVTWLDDMVEILPETAVVEELEAPATTTS